jgi:hypothetical protein
MAFLTAPANVVPGATNKPNSCAELIGPNLIPGGPPAIINRPFLVSPSRDQLSSNSAGYAL